MQPTVCQACGGKIETPQDRQKLANPNICLECASDWGDSEEPQPETCPPVRLFPIDPLHDERLLEVI